MALIDITDRDTAGYFRANFRHIPLPSLRDGSIDTMRPLVYVSRRLLSRLLSFVYFGYWVFCGIAYRGPVRLSAVSIVSTSPPALVRWPQSVRPHVRSCTDHYHLARRMRAGLLMRRPACLYLSLWLLVYLSACIPTHPTFVCDPPSHSLPPTDRRDGEGAGAWGERRL